MASDIVLPELGENVEGGIVVEIRVAVGDQIKPNQTLLEVEAGKSTVEVPSTIGGSVAEILVHKGDEVTTGQVLLRVEAGEAAEPETEQSSTPAKLEKQSEANGEATAAPTATVTEKKTTEKKAPEKIAPEKKEAEPVRTISETRPNTPKPTPATPNYVSSPFPEEHTGTLVPASPATRLLARELGVDLAQVKGTAKHGRVTPEDVKDYVRQLASGRGGAAGSMVAPRLPDFSKWGQVERQPLSGIRQETARQMALAWSLIPHVTQHDQADITDLEAFRRAQPKEGPKITVTAFALKAVAVSLRQFPQFNATLDLGNRQLILKRYYHVGVAVDTERGLLVPVLRDVDKKSIHDLAGELTEVAERGRNRKLSGEDLSGGTFTITNLGGLGGTGFTPIINYPEVAILGLSRAVLQPVVYQGNIVPRLMLPLSLSYDHRVIDGADAARFTRRIAEMLQSPLTLLLHV